MHVPLRHQGFTLTETLVALVATMVVVGSVMVFAASAMRSNAQILAGARLLRQMQHSLDTVANDIRRAGYYDDAARFAPTAQSPGLSDLPVIHSASCVVVRYDRDGALFRGYRQISRKGIGVIQSATSRAGEVDCAGRSGETWHDITDPASMDVLEFSVAPVPEASGCANRHGFAVITQDVDVHLKARPVGNAAVERALAETARVRNDIMASGTCT
jgi:type II secretory pathway component PulJ